MSDVEFHNERRPAWRVVRAMAAELQMQGVVGSMLNEHGQIEVSGKVDLAHLANIVEVALEREFRV